MTLIEWFKRRGTKSGGEQARWRQSWTTAVDAEDTSILAALRNELKSLSAVAEDVEVEEEMLDALQHLSDLRANVGDGPLPAIETHHRVVGSDACHFSAPASLPDDPAQPSGRVLLTNARSLFLGGTQGSTIPWHSIRDVLRIERDVLLVRADGSPAAHFRFNSFTEAVTAMFIARRLKSEGTL
ncbi:hypothetical protein BH18ACI5_BH18ACI5_18130 [soil metagenome]